MAQLKPGKNPLVMLIIIMAIVSIAAGILAGVHYYVIDLPSEKQVFAPSNNYNGCDSVDCCQSMYQRCKNSGDYTPTECRSKRDNCISAIGKK